MVRKILCSVVLLAVAVIALAAHAQPAQAAGPGPLPCKQGRIIGCILTSLDGINAYYNGPDPSVDQAFYEYGLAWQCVEFVQRYYAALRGYPALWSPPYAYQIFDRGGHPSTLTAYPNGSGTGPQEGDILVFDRTDYAPYGHVAIVKSVANGQITFVQQNVGDVGQDSLPIDNQNLITSRYPYGPVRGWLKDNTGKPTADVSGLDTGNDSSGTADAGPVIGWLRDHTEGKPVAIFRLPAPTGPAPTDIAAALPAAGGDGLAQTPTPSAALADPTATPVPSPMPPSGLGQLAVRNWFGRGDADLTVDGRVFVVPQNGVAVTVALQPGHYTWTFHLPNVESVNGSTDIQAGQTNLIQFSSR